MANKTIDLTTITIEELLDLVVESYHELGDQLLEQGVSADVVNGALFCAFSERMAELGDRDYYNEVLEEALSTPWDSDYDNKWEFANNTIH